MSVVLNGNTGLLTGRVPIIFDKTKVILSLDYSRHHEGDIYQESAVDWRAYPFFYGKG